MDTATFDPERLVTTGQWWARRDRPFERWQVRHITQSGDVVMLDSSKMARPPRVYLPTLMCHWVLVKPVGLHRYVQPKDGKPRLQILEEVEGKRGMVFRVVGELRRFPRATS